MKIPFVDLKSQYASIKEEVDAAIAGVIENTAFIGGSKFEPNYKELYGVRDCIAVANGTDAIFIALKALGIGAGDEVIVPANTWISTAETVTMAGADPVFVDCDEKYYHIDIDEIEAAITPRTKAIIPVHLYGQAVDMPRIMEIVEKHNLKLIEDCAQSHLSKFDGKLSGTFGDAGTFSFYPGKNLGAYGDAGGIITNDKELGKAMRIFANHGALVKHQHSHEGMNSRMDGIQAAVLNVKLKYIAEWTELRKKAASFYDTFLSDISEIEIPKRRPNADHVFHLYVIRTDRREELAVFLNSKGIASGIHYPTALPFMEAYKRFNHIPEDFPNAFSQQSRILSLPIFPELNEEKAKFVAGTIKEFFNK
jgi:dTDP-4-amino-4,6-dideoxygalactose transaminase